jgi:hypothetical protein
MPNKRPPNAEATQFRSGEEAVKNGRKGGVNSGVARREKKTIQKTLIDLLDSDIKGNPQFAKLASKIGVGSDKSIKDVFTMVCLLNSVKSGNLSDLEKLMKLLGEDKISSGESHEEDDPLTKALREEAERLNNANIE